MPNHYHLLLQEIVAGGIRTFMQKLGVGFTNYSNTKYGESGRIFQGPYKAKVIGSEEYLQYVSAYIQVFNPFELLDGGSDAAFEKFDKAFKNALDYQFCSLGESFNRRNLSIIDKDFAIKKFPTLEKYKEFAKNSFLKKDPTGAYKNACIDAV